LNGSGDDILRFTRPYPGNHEIDPFRIEQLRDLGPQLIGCAERSHRQ
jgi:hypothetical protein